MKLTSIALLLGGTALGTQVGGTSVHEELHTERLVLHSKDRDRMVTITSTDEAGVLIALGDAQSLTTAQFKIEPEMHSWILSFEHELGAQFQVELTPSAAYAVTSAGSGGATARLEAFRVLGGGGIAHAQFHPGGETVTGEACSIGVQESIGASPPHAFLRLRQQEHWADDEDGNPMYSWQNVLQIGGDEAFLVSPWVTKPR